MRNNNNIPQGYKDSPLGVIPQDWEVSRLGEVCDIYVAKDLKPDCFSETPSSKYKYKIFSNTVQENCIYGYYNFEEYPKHAITIVGRGVGLGTAFPRHEGFGAIGRLIIAYPKRGSYVYYCEYINHSINILVESAAIPQLTGVQMSTYKILLPPISEQERIADVLGCWDMAIEKQCSLVDALTRRKRALMQQLLTACKRLPNFFVPWQSVKLGEIFSERNETKHTELPLLSITANQGVILQSESDKKDTSNEDKSKYKRICCGDIGYNTMRMWQGRSALSQIEGIVSPAYTIVTPRVNTNSVYFKYLFKMPRMTYKFWTHSQGLVNDTLNCKYHDFATVTVKIPQLEEQKAIAQILTTADQEIESTKTKLEALRIQKRGLMQQLLTGKKRLKI